VKNKVISRDRCRDCSARARSTFKGMGEEELNEIDRVRSLVEFKAGASLPLSYDDDEGFYCIRKGHQTVTLRKSQKSGIARVSGPGDLVGYDLHNENLEIKCLENGSACFFPKKRFIAIQNRYNKISNAVIEMLCKIIHLKDTRISVLQNHTVRTRVAGLLASLDAKFGIVSEHGRFIDVRIDRGSLSKLAGTSAESLSRTLTELEDAGAIKRSGRGLHIVNKSKLEKLSEE
jgi:CRP-like cAMP-binding protein